MERELGLVTKEMFLFALYIACMILANIIGLKNITLLGACVPAVGFCMPFLFLVTAIARVRPMATRMLPCLGIDRLPWRESANELHQMKSIPIGFSRFSVLLDTPLCYLGVKWPGEED